MPLENYENNTQVVHEIQKEAEKSLTYTQKVVLRTKKKGNWITVASLGFGLSTGNISVIANSALEIFSWF